MKIVLLSLLALYSSCNLSPDNPFQDPFNDPETHTGNPSGQKNKPKIVLNSLTKESIDKLSEAELFQGVSDAAKTFKLGDDSLQTITSNLFDAYAKILSNNKVSYGYFPNWEIKDSKIDMVVFSHVLEYYTEGDVAFDKEGAGIVLLLKSIAKNFPKRKLFNINNFEQTAFETLLSFEATPKVNAFRDEMITTLLADADFIKDSDLTQNNPIYLAKNEKIIEQLMTAMNIKSLDTKCVQKIYGELYGPKNELSQLACALLQKMPENAVATLIKHGANPLKTFTYKNEKLNALMLSAKIAVEPEVIEAMLANINSISAQSIGKWRYEDTYYEPKSITPFSWALRNMNEPNGKLLVDQLLLKLISEPKALNEDAVFELSVSLGLSSTDKTSKEKYLSVAQKLLEAGANYEGKVEELPIFQAVLKAKEFKLVRALLDRAKKDGKEASITRTNGQSVWQIVFKDSYSALGDDEKSALALLESGVSIVGDTALIKSDHTNGGNPVIMTLLASAVQKEWKKFIEALLTRAKSEGLTIIDEKSQNPNETALQIAFKNYLFDEDVIKTLLEQGASIYDENGTTIEHESVTIKDSGTILSKKAHLSFLVVAIHKKNANVIKAILERAKKDGRLNEILEYKSEMPQSAQKHEDWLNGVNFPGYKGIEPLKHTALEQALLLNEKEPSNETTEIVKALIKSGATASEEFLKNIDRKVYDELKKE